MKSIEIQLKEALEALTKIYNYRSDKPDWNMVMAIAGDVVDPQVMVVTETPGEFFPPKTLEETLATILSMGDSPDDYTVWKGTYLRNDDWRLKSK